MNTLQTFVGILFFCTTALAGCTGGSGGGWGSHHHSHGGWSSSNPNVQPDNSTLDQLYQKAIAEGGTLVVYAGGDAPDQLDDTKRSFETRFPNVKVEMVVDLSKYHDVRIDEQLRTNTVVVDIAQLQTLDDFPRWKREGALMQYKPIDWKHVYPEFKDEDGFYTGAFMSAFSNNINAQLLPNNATWPIEARDYLKPEFKDKIVVTYPNDDDAVLFWFKQVVDKYGHGYLDQFKAQNPHFVRGTATAYGLVTAGTYVATMSADGGIRNYDGLPKFVVPKNDPFVLWPQTAAILKNAPHPAAAKLYMSWLVDKQTQDADWSWSVRDDVTAPAPYRSVWGYGRNGDPLALGRFMSNRAELNRFKAEITRVFGPVVGASPTDPDNTLGTHPVKGIAH